MQDRHPEVLASSASLEGRRPGVAARVLRQLGLASFEAPGAMHCIAPLAPQDDGTAICANPPASRPAEYFRACQQGSGGSEKTGSEKRQRRPYLTIKGKAYIAGIF